MLLAMFLLPCLLWAYVHRYGENMDYVYEGNTDPWYYTFRGILTYFQLTLSFVPLPIPVVMDTGKVFYAMAIANDAELMGYNAYD